MGREAIQAPCKTLRPVSARNLSPRHPTTHELGNMLIETDDVEDNDNLPSGCIRSLTPSTIERGWRVPYAFPFCTKKGGNLKTYYKAIGKGYSFFATEKSMSNDEKAILLKTISDGTVNPYGVMIITMYDATHRGRG